MNTNQLLNKPYLCEWGHSENAKPILKALTAGEIHSICMQRLKSLNF